jgi:hypothetical protein
MVPQRLPAVSSQNISVLMACRNPAIRPLAIGTAGAIAGAVLTPLLVPVGLGFIGFGAAGPVAGEFSQLGPYKAT